MKAWLPAGAAPARDAADTEPIATYIVLGVVQGLALWALYHALHDRPGPIGPFFAAMLQFSLAGPLAWYLSAATFSSALVRAGLALVVGGLLAALGAHAAATGDAFAFDRIVASAVLGYVIVALAGAALALAQHRLGTPAGVFNGAFFNALLVGSGALTAALFVQRAVHRNDAAGEHMAEPLLIAWGTLWLLFAVSVCSTRCPRRRTGPVHGSRRWRSACRASTSA